MKDLLRLRRTRLLVLIPVSLCILLLAKSNETIAEYIFARGIYKVISQIISFVTGFVPISLAEVILFILPFFILIIVIIFIRNIIKAKDRRRFEFAKGILNLLCSISIVLFLYILLCGTNYYRYDFTEFSNLTVQDSSVEELSGLCLELTERANELRNEITSVDSDGVMQIEESSIYETADKAKAAMSALAVKYPILKGYYSSPKPVLFSNYMSWTEIEGIFIPFTMEANVNTDIVDYNIPADMCHELAHLHGFMKEEEANYIAYLACVNSGDKEFEYSGVMLALYYARNALYNADEGLYMQADSALSDEVKADFTANYEYWNDITSQKLASAISEASGQVNDAYLKVNGQEAGVKSYGQMLDLLLAEYRAKHQ